MIVKSEKYKILIAHYKKNKLQHLCQCSTNEPKYSLILPINGILDFFTLPLISELNIYIG